MSSDGLFADERITIGSGNVFLDLGFEEGEAHALAVQAELFGLLQKRIGERKWTKAQVSQRLRVTREHAMSLMKGHWEDEFSVDELLALAWRAGLRTKLETRD